MIAEFVRSVDGIQILGIAGLCLSFSAFCFIVVRVWRADRAQYNALARLPFESDDATPSETRK